MPEHDDSSTAGQAATRSGWPAAGASGDHPVLRELDEAARLMSNAEAFLSPTREFDEPHLVESDWPRDLDRPETRVALGHLADIISSLGGCTDGIRCHHNVPESAKPEFDTITALLLDAGRKLDAQTRAPSREADSASPAQRAALNRSWLLIPALAGAGLLIGICSHWWPELPGNGRSILTTTLASGMTLTTAAAVLALKPLLTAVFLRAGATGGMLTPALATGAAAGTLFVLTINAAAGTHFHIPAISLAGAAGVLAVTQGTPIWAAIFVWELARPPLWLLLVFLTTALGAYGFQQLVERNSG